MIRFVSVGRQRATELPSTPFIYPQVSRPGTYDHIDTIAQRPDTLRGVKIN